MDFIVEGHPIAGMQSMSLHGSTCSVPHKDKFRAERKQIDKGLSFPFYQGGRRLNLKLIHLAVNIDGYRAHIITGFGNAGGEL